MAFFVEPTQFDASPILSTILGEYRAAFNGPIQSIPMPVEFDTELPRLQIGGPQSEWVLAASPARLVIEWRNVQDLKEVDAVAKSAQCAEFAVAAARAACSQLARLGLVLQRYVEVADPADALIARFCEPSTYAADNDDSPLRHSVSFQIHNHKRYECGLGFLVNSWVRCKTAMINSNAHPAITVEQDINTPLETGRMFAAEEISTFVAMAISESNAALGKYFP